MWTFTTTISFENDLIPGKVGITLNCDWMVPKNPDDPADWNAADRALEFHLGWFAHPIFIDGDYPQIMKDYISRHSRGTSRLPEFTEDEKKMIKGKVCGALGQ